jgi:hypothetical protein
MTRRKCFGLVLALVPLHAFAKQRLGDDEWMRHFREFVKQFNTFVESLQSSSYFPSQKCRF